MKSVRKELFSAHLVLSLGSTASEAVLLNRRDHSYIHIFRMVFTNTSFKSKGTNDEVLKYGSELPHPF